MIELPASSFYLATGAPLAVFAGGASAVPGSEFTGSEAFGIRWNNNATLDGVVTSRLVPPDMDITANATLVIHAAKIGATPGDLPTFDATVFNQPVGALYDADATYGGTTSAMTNAATKTVQSVTLTLALANLAAFPARFSLSIKPTDGTLGTDDLLMTGAHILYTKKAPRLLTMSTTNETADARRPAAPVSPITLGLGLRLDAGADDRPCVWNVVAYEGEWQGHPAGAFGFSRATFEQIIANFCADPRYKRRGTAAPRAAAPEQIESGIFDVIQWDFHHAAEMPAPELAVAGAPAQGWVLELAIGDYEGKCALLALTRWLEPARGYIRGGRYKFCSVSVWLQRDRPGDGQGRRRGAHEHRDHEQPIPPGPPGAASVALRRAGARGQALVQPGAFAG